MKILKLTLKNINSLVGINTIDFTAPAFTDDGLFAITGKTGAGKTSILDAIALALYGKTPRVEITGSDNPVMTRGERDCFAEIRFEVNGKVWTSAWKQETTRTGKLKPVQRVIADADGTIHADQVRACDQKIIEIIGLNFEQFTKVIMLAQGSFAAFLQANKNEKGELLEQITGTEIYGEISKKVFERHNLEKNKLDQIRMELEAIQLLAPDEIGRIEAEMADYEKEKKHIDDALAQLESGATWWRSMAELEKQISGLHVELPALRDSTAEAQTHLNQSQQALQSAKQRRTEQVPLLKQVNALDTQLADRRALLDPLLRNITELKEEHDKLEKTIERQRAELQQAEAEWLEKKNWATEHAHYEALIADFNTIQQQHHDVKARAKELHQKQQAVEELTRKQEKLAKELTDSQNSFNHQKQLLAEKGADLEKQKVVLHKILGGRTTNELQAELGDIKTFGQLVKNLHTHEKNTLKAQREITEITVKYGEAERGLSELDKQIEQHEKRTEDLDRRIELLEENIRLARTIQSLEDHRHQLVDGQPCPLCGATAHPFATGDLPRIDDKDKELAQCRLDRQTLTRQLDHEKQQRTKISAEKDFAKTLLQKEHDRLSQHEQDRQDILAELQAIQNDFVLPPPENVLADLDGILSQKRDEYNAVERTIKEAKDAERTLETIRDHDIPALENHLRQSEIAMNELAVGQKVAQRDLELQGQALGQLRATHEEKMSALATTYSVYGVDNIVALQQCRDDWQANQKACEMLQKKQGETNEKLAINTNEFRNKTLALARENTEIEKLNTTISTLTQKRHDLFGDKSTEVEERRIEKTIQDAEQAVESAQRTHQALNTKLTTQQNLVKQAEKNLNELREKQLATLPLDELETAISEHKQKTEYFSRQIGALSQQLKFNAEQHKAIQNKLAIKEKQQDTYEQWARLNELIGSADGKKYRNFAQALTFEYLIDLANQQLLKMSDRYLLKRTGDSSNPFDLLVIDKYQNGEERTAQNLSGGEKFIMSLSLALGLANMASKNMRIDTMFIDEGFGTLDSDYLDVALSALSNLQSEGKIIGVISHLAELKERIATHIEIVPTTSGHSEIQVTA